jgi:hypothetical protein
MTTLHAGQRNKVTVHVGNALGTLSAIRSNPLRARRTVEYLRHLDTLESDLLSIVSRLTNDPPRDEDIEADLRAAVNMLRDLNQLELESVRKDVEAAFLEFPGES